MASENLIVKDEDYYTASYKVKRLGTYLSEASAYYCKILQYIIDEAVLDELISQKFSSILDEIQPLSENITEFTTGLSENLESYVTEIDEKDSFLY